MAEALLPLLPRVVQQLLQELGPGGSSQQPLVHLAAVTGPPRAPSAAPCLAAAHQP